MKKVALFCLLLFAISSYGQNQQRTIYISLVEKGTVSTFFNRLATVDYHVVITPKPISKAIHSIALTEEQGKTIHLVETPSYEIPKLRGEIMRFHNIVVVSLATDNTHDHIHYPGMPDIYMEKVRPALTSVPKTISTQAKVISDQNSDFFRSIQIDKQFLRGKLSELSGAVSVKVGKNIVKISERKSDQGRKNAREYLRQEYEKLGFTVSFHNYDSGWRKGANIIAEKKGQNANKYFIVSAHYDTVSTAGADDDGTGIVAGLAVAKALKDAQLAYSLRIVGFDHEEVGLVGSRAYADHLNRTGELNNLMGLIQIEMLGYDADGDGGFHVIDCDENSSPQITDMVMKTVFAEGIDLHLVAACTNRSDHASFWRYNKPAIVISQNFFGGDSNPCYHRSCDKINLIDFDYMEKVTTAIAKTVAKVLVVNPTNK